MTSYSRLPLTPPGVVLPSGDSSMNFLIKMSLGRISKFITCSLFFKLISFLPLSFHFFLSHSVIKILGSIHGQ